MIFFGPYVRRRSEANGDLVAEEFKNGKWVEIFRTNEETNRWAYTQTGTICMRRRDQLEAEMNLKIGP